MGVRWCFLEMEIQSLRLLVNTRALKGDWIRERYEIDEKRMWALYLMQCYQKRIARAFNKKVKLRNLKVGDLVLKELRGEISDPRCKIKPRWIMLEGAVKITNLDAKEIFQPMNMDRLWKCNLWKENERKKNPHWVENPKGRPRQKLGQWSPARLTTRKDDLGKN